MNELVNFNYLIIYYSNIIYSNLFVIMTEQNKKNWKSWSSSQTKVRFGFDAFQLSG